MQHSRSRSSRARLANILTIAGSDSGGGAGIQADLRTFMAFGLHGLSALTAVTAQNTRRIASVHCVPARELSRQLETLFDDFDIRAVKIGMLASSANITAVAGFLRRHAIKNVVLDPILVASAGSRLLPSQSVAALRTRLLPLADLITPNLPEAQALLGSDAKGMQAARELLAMGTGAVLLKGGHAKGAVVRDFFVGPCESREFRHRRLPYEAHGTGCVLSAAIAANLALGYELTAAVARAEAYLNHVLTRSRNAGRGNVRLLGLGNLSASTNKSLRRL